jgi:hypothetical protein
MYYVTKTNGLTWQPTPEPRTQKSGWDEMGFQLRWDCLLKRTQNLCDGYWFDERLSPRSQASQQTIWNTIAELMLLGALEKGYMAFVRPSNSNGFKLELIGCQDTLKILVAEDGGIIWDLYRDGGAEEFELDYSNLDKDALLSRARGHYGPDGEEFGGEGELKLGESAEVAASGYYYPEYDGSELLSVGRKFRHTLTVLLSGCRQAK